MRKIGSQQSSQIDAAPDPVEHAHQKTVMARNLKPFQTLFPDRVRPAIRAPLIIKKMGTETRDAALISAAMI